MEATEEKQTLRTLRRANIAAAILHAASAIAQFVILMVYINKLYMSAVTVTDGAGVTTVMGHYPVGALVVLVSAITTTFHLLYAAKTYAKQTIRSGFSSLRWTEYSITAGLMTVVVAQLAGATNFWVLIALVVSNAVMQFCGYMMEQHHYHEAKHGTERKHTSFTGFIIGAVLFVEIWTIIAYYFGSSVAASGFANIPWFVTASFIGVFVTFALFGLWQFLRFVRADANSSFVFTIAKDNGNYELGYVVLSLLAKLYLGWILFGAFIAIGSAA